MAAGWRRRLALAELVTLMLVTVQVDPTFRLRAADGSIASCRPDPGLARRLARVATGED